MTLARLYYGSKERGKSIPVFKFAYAAVLRFLLVFLNVLRFNRQLYADYKGLTSDRFWKRLLGINKFEVSGLLPLGSSFDRFAFPLWEVPQVSIIVCVHNHIDYTYNSLLSILNNTADVSYEVIVVNDCSTDETGQVLEDIENLVVIDNAENLGFLKSCNKALAHAKGQYICFLNNDVQVQPNWLANLLAPFGAFDNVGLVGAKLIYPYGLLQEAGGIVNDKGQPANYGKFRDPDDIHYNYLRETDYCSGACILLSKNDLDELNGFDEAFAPAYYEDTDLAFRVRYRLNKKVYYQPLAKVVHFEGVSSGKVSDGSNVKRYQDINAQKFRERWAPIFSTFPVDGDATANARKFVSEKRTILIIEPLLPTFDQDSGSRRMFELIKLLIELGWNVIFSPEARTQEEPYYSTLVNMGVWVLNKPVFRKSSKYVIRQVVPWVEEAWVCRPHMNRRYGGFVRQFGIRWMNDTVDIHFLREERALETGNIDPRRSRKVKRRKKRELSLLRAANTVIAITTAEAELLNGYGIKHVTVIPNVHYPAAVALPGFRDRQGICFIGGYRHLPNVDAAKWLVKEIMPLVWAQHPEINVYLLGSQPPKEITELQSARVHVPGYLPDVSSYFLSSRVFVAPLRFGAGMKGKIGQSFEFGLPVVTTDIGAEGMGLIDRKHYLRANTVQAFVESIIELYGDAELWSTLSAGAVEALEQYAPRRVRDELQKLLG